MPIKHPFENISKAAQALKDVLEADSKTIEDLPPLERLLAKEIRKEVRYVGGVKG